MLGLVIIGFVLPPVLHYEPSAVALLGAPDCSSAPPPSRPAKYSARSNGPLAFFAGLFIMIGGLIATGVIGEISNALPVATGDSGLGRSMLLLGGARRPVGHRGQPSLRRHHGAHHQ
ncbi:hypothetical protein [Streptomyces longisporoflavus]|uniref:hypothetical protein n=1 Tax=Streptomyces longisporoflavus TaxID=28044 RepID=UPI001E3737C4|nr:hypothetical protein [Streptomyces longisporoflavus]